MKVLLTGASGQVGFELARSLPPVAQVTIVNRQQMDLANPEAIRSVIRSLRPDLIVNPAAYTMVDLAETQADEAYRINATAPAVMAAEARRLGAAMIHYSTDYVFDGTATRPYREDDAPGPRSVYGNSKLEGEQAVAAAGIPHLIFRTSWVYGMRGRNFLQSVLRMVREKNALRIVADQVGAPTWSRTVADLTTAILMQAKASEDPGAWWRGNSGIYALTCSGRTTWHGFAQAIVNRLDRQVQVHPIATRDYPTQARRPAYSVLSLEKLERTFNTRPPHWEQALAACMEAR